MDETVFDFDGDYGKDYEALARQVIPGYRTLFPMFTAIIEPDLPPGARVLVVGAGTGIELIALKRARPDLRLHGVDPSEQMLQIAERRVAEAGLESGVTLQLGYASDVPTRPRFDAATLINVLHFVPDDGAKSALLHDIAGRLRPGAVFVLFDLHGDPGLGGARALHAGVAALLEDPGDDGGRDGRVRRADPPRDPLCAG